jgi:hypothetical protein
MNSAIVGIVLIVATAVIGAADSTEQRRPKLTPPPERLVLSAGQKALETVLVGQVVVLAHELYSISYPGLAPNGRRTALTEGLLSLSPDKPAVYRFVEVGGGLVDLSDSDPNRLLDKVQAARPPHAAAATKLLKYITGSKLKVSGVSWGARLLRIELDDPAVRVRIAAGVPATTVSIIWPQTFSSAFAERAAVEAEIAKALTRQPGGVQ